MSEATSGNCPRCGGTGRYRNLPGTPDRPCALCDGTGVPKDYDPMADVIAANQESVVRVLREALRRVRAAIDAGDIRLAKEVIEAANKFHPMHGESWGGWPESS